jgi:hypothetical protein
MRLSRGPDDGESKDRGEIPGATKQLTQTATYRSTDTSAVAIRGAKWNNILCGRVFGSSLVGTRDIPKPK